MQPTPGDAIEGIESEHPFTDDLWYNGMQVGIKLQVTVPCKLILPCARVSLVITL